jgi:DNA modification methylase
VAAKRPQLAERNGYHAPLGRNGHAADWNEYVVGDARNLCEYLPCAPSVDVTVTSPPYWDVKDYGTANQIGYRQSLDQYMDDLVAVFSAVWKCTRPNGSLWVVMKSVKKDGRVYQLPFLLSERLTALSSQAWRLQDVLVWHKTHTLPWSHRQKLTDNYEHILCFSKSADFELNLDAIRSTAGITNYWVKYPERYHPAGKSLSNVWEIAIPTQGSWGSGHFEHSCPLPVELVKRAILLSTEGAGTVLDPFAGTGSVPLAAHQLGRRWMALDANRNYRAMFHRRLAEEQSEPRCGMKSEIDLLAANLSLRQLKYGHLLYKLVAPSQRLTAADVPLIAVRGGQRLKAPGSHWVKGVWVQLVLTDAQHRTRGAQVLAEVVDQMGKAPLSKFQLDVTASVLPLSQFLKQHPFGKKQRLHRYDRGEFWSSKGEVKSEEMGKLEPVGKLPVIVSDILVREQPAY